MSQTTPSPGSGASKNSADSPYCRPCVFVTVRADPHSCEGNCSCEGQHVAQACGEIMIPKVRRTVDDVSTGGFL